MMQIHNDTTTYDLRKDEAEQEQDYWGQRIPEPLVLDALSRSGQVKQS